MIVNPILPGFNPDPCICRKGDDYYMAVSTFEWFPGITVYRSRNLRDWEFAAAPLNDDQKLDLRGIDTACGIWAPNLTYDNGRFYLIYTIVYTNRSRFKDTHNFLVTLRAHGAILYFSTVPGSPRPCSMTVTGNGWSI